jgi:hypothetical protein
MKTISLICAHCNNNFEKSLKEYKRRTKEGHGKFYCCLSCAALSVTKNNLPNPHEPSRKANNDDHLRRITKLAIKTNTRYTEEDKKFQEYIRKSQKRKQHDFDITIEYLKEVWNKQDGKCAISKIPLIHSLHTNNHNIMASLDRIDSAKGYIKGNVQFLSCALNYAKNSGTDESLRDLISLIQKYSD